MTQKAELLRLAGVLASQGSPPVWVSHNRAVSTAYYALFHSLAELCARELVGAFKPWAPFRHVYRSLERSQARDVLTEFQKDASTSIDLRRFAVFIIELQELRHGADYDPGFRISKAELDRLLEQTKDGVASLGTLGSPERKILAARLIGRARRSRPSPQRRGNRISPAGQQ